MPFFGDDLDQAAPAPGPVESAPAAAPVPVSAASPESPSSSAHLAASATSATAALKPTTTSLAHASDLAQYGRLFSHQRTSLRKLSEESIRTELCEGPIPGSPPAPTTPDNRADTQSQGHTDCSDRSELIERLKRSQRSWVPDPVSPSPRHNRAADSPSSSLLPAPTITPEKQARARHEPEPSSELLQYGLNMERPRSALHSGDFTQDEHQGLHDRSVLGDNEFAPRHSLTLEHYASTRESSNSTSGSLVDSKRKSATASQANDWLATSPPRDFSPFNFAYPYPAHSHQHEPAGLRIQPTTPASLSTALSSVASSFAYKPPTSPLVQSESNEDDGMPSPPNALDISSAGVRHSRRHTLSSSHFGSCGFPASPLAPARSSPMAPVFRQERSFPSQAHQPRRSLTSAPVFSATASPQTPGMLRPRRPSLSSDVSPIQHASMVGSYEESILRGRMSTTPSKPLDFVAQIGVLGLGKCKSSLRCPPHVTLPFPAVFYSYASASSGPFKMEDGPSPYVGQVDLENGLPNQEEDARAKRKKQSRASNIERAVMAGGEPASRLDIERTSNVSDRSAHKTPNSPQQRPKRRSSSPRAPPGGSYRIPEKGQVQIIIKNPNKTAVKLFLVPYDLAGMEPGTKTFIRQRSYSTGPIIDSLPASGSGDGVKDGGGDRPILRYLVHLHICCPSRGRFYLYKSIRVVFANRVPDGKERLRNEITLPEPRFSGYKPICVMPPPASAANSLAAEKAFRRRSSGLHFGAPGGSAVPAVAPHHAMADVVDGSPSSPSSLLQRQRLMRQQQELHVQGRSPGSTGSHSVSFDMFAGNAPVDPIPFHATSNLDRVTRPHAALEDSSDLRPDVDGDIQRHQHPAKDPPSSALSSPQTTTSTNNSGSRPATGATDDGGNAFSRYYDKLNKGDIGYGPGAHEGLLSQRLRTLGVKQGQGFVQGQNMPSPSPHDKMEDGEG